MQRKWIVSLIVCVGVFMSSLDLFIVNIAFPSIAKHFGGASLSSLSWILSGYAIVFAALLVPAGRWADAFGRKRAFLLGLAIFVASSAACALSPSVEFLIGARVVQAIGGALMLPTSLGLMLPEFGAHERHVAIGVWAATGGIAAASGPPLGGLLVQADWRLVFLVNVPVGLLGLGFGLRTLAERRERNAARPDVAGALALMLAVGALVVAIVKGQEWGWGSARVIALLVVTAVLLPAIWLRSERHEAPIVEPSMLRVRTFGLAVGASLLFFAGFGAMLLSGVLFLTGVWHESVVTAGLMLFPGPAMATAFSIPSARLGARYGYRLPGVVGALAFAAGSVWFIVRTGDKPEFLSEYLPGQIVTGAGVGLMIPTLTGAGASSLAPERFATGAAVLTMGRQIGVALGVAVLVAVLGANPTSAADFHTAWLIVVAGGLAAGLALAAIGPPVLNAAGAGGPARPVISEPIADPVIVEPLIAEEAA
ncbi:MAG TPA: MFS transporter [Solirubrobacteraceae bacterium]|jgi:EmrB/QacA subfamily drug resistance transporter|nr:MFS transporter [Solirubrobacteraceae bacterium]